ncbi:MAG TPA: cupin domain-containing protein [Steroidobacteraceae bacterium]
MTEAIAPRIVDFSSVQPETSVGRPAAEVLLGGNPETTTRNYFTDSGGRFFCGVWESTPGSWRIRYTENEFCHITRGRIRIADANGRQWTFKAGDSFVIPAGFVGTWETLEPTAKLYVIYEPAAS